MSPIVLRSAVHVAVLDPMVGVGIVQCPHEDDDLDIDALAPTLAAADFESLMVQQVDPLGFDTREGDDDPYGFGLALFGRHIDGRALILLTHPDPIVSEPDGQLLVDSCGELLELLASLTD